MSCEHTPMLVIYKGEDSTFNGNKRPVITLISPHDIEGYTATFDFFNLHQEFSAEQVSKKKLPLTYTAEQTKTLPFGMNYATLVFKSPGKLTETVKLVIGVSNRNYVIVEGMGVAIDGAYETDAEILSKTDVTPLDYTNGSIAEATLKMWKKLGGTVLSILVAACAFAELPPGMAYNKDLKADTPVVTNVDAAIGGQYLTKEEAERTYLKTLEPATNYTDAATGALAMVKRDLTDLAVYRKVKDCWTWTNWRNPVEQAAHEAPEDFLTLANSPGSEPIFFKNGAWWGAVQFWPNGKLKYSQSEIPPGGTGELSTRVNFAMYAYDETGTNEIYRFGATATRTDPTNETVVAWDETHNGYIRFATTDLVDDSIRRQIGTATNGLAPVAYVDAATNGIRRIDGEARMLPPYLHVLSFDDGYPDDAAWYFDQIDHLGYCSSARRGDTYVRNYDWRYDESATFVIRMSAASNRFASVGISNVGTNLTEAIVTSGAWSRYYRCLPGHTLDGINERGLVCNINVVTTNGSPWESHVDGDGRTLNILGACRYLLDNYFCASNAAAYVAAHAYVPMSMQKLGDSIHLMVADAKETWIVEDGVAHLLTPDVGAYMTNFRRFNPDGTTPAVDPYGAGFERAALLADPSRPLLDGLTNAWYTHAYRRLPDDSFPWPTEFAGMVDDDGPIPNTETDRLQQWAKDNVPDVPLQRGLGWWQTVHSSRYDIPSRTLRVAVQERNDWYAFSLDGIVTTHYVQEQIKNGINSDKIAKTAETTPIPPNLTNLVSYINYKEHEGVTIPEDEDGSVVIGKNANGTVSPTYIASLTNKTTRTTLRSASVAIGMNADATGGKDGGTAQSIAIGWNSKAKASNAIAIGSGAVHWFEDDETGPAAIAAGSESIALGYEAKAKASGSMQIGRGRNEEPNSLKFWDTYIVKDGKVQGSLDTNAVKTLVSENLDPTLVQDLTDELTVKSHALTTYAPTNGVPDELALTPTGTRNYEIYLPNTAEMRAALPMSFLTEIEGDVTKLGPWWNKKATRLPVKIAVKEPLPKTLILEVEEYETDWDWTPVVVSATCSNATVNVVGTNLHWMVSATLGGTNYPISNPLYGQLHFSADVPIGTEGQLKDAEGVSRVTFTIE